MRGRGCSPWRCSRRPRGRAAATSGRPSNPSRHPCRGAQLPCGTRSRHAKPQVARLGTSSRTIATAAMLEMSACGNRVQIQLLAGCCQPARCPERPVPRHCCPWPRHAQRQQGVERRRSRGPGIRSSPLSRYARPRRRRSTAASWPPPASPARASPRSSPAARCAGSTFRAPTSTRPAR
jgi:hypothetical protein